MSVIRIILNRFYMNFMTEEENLAVDNILEDLTGFSSKECRRILDEVMIVKAIKKF